MSSLSHTEKRYLEKLLGMESGYVLDYRDATFEEFFKRHGIIIHGSKYQTYGLSKAKKMRSFWEQEPDHLVGKVLSEMLESYEAACDLNGTEIDVPVLDKTRGIVARLLGRPVARKSFQSEDDFLDHEFTIPNIQNLPIEAQAVPIIESRLSEALNVMKAGAHLSVILLCGSVLEAVLLGAAQKEPSRFNQASASPKDNDGSVKPSINGVWHSSLMWPARSVS